MKTIYQQKADPKILKECEEFIKEHKNDSNDKEVGHLAVQNAGKLVTSLVKSKDLQELIKDIRELGEKIAKSDDDFEKIRMYHEIDEINSRYCIDSQANKILKELEKIQSKNLK